MILIALAAPPARADAPRLVFGYLGPQVTIERVLLVVRDDPPGTAHLVLSLAATHVTRRELSATIQLPAGARVTGFAYAGGGDDRRVARPMPARQAAEAYGGVKASHGGALVEAAGPDRITLRVPIAEDLPAEIELELALPPISSLAIDPGGQVVRRAELRIPGAPPRIWDDSSVPRTAALPPASAPPVRPPPGGVSAATSLVLGEAPVVVIGPPVTPCCGCGTVDARSIRRVVRQHHPQLRHCYMRVAQGNPRLAGTAVLHFTIAPGGRVTSPSVSGDLGSAEVERCLAGEVARWSFASAGNAEVRVNYPLTFRIARRTGAVP